MITKLKIVLNKVQMHIKIVFRRMKGLAKRLIDLAAYPRLSLIGLPRITIQTTSSSKVISLISKTI